MYEAKKVYSERLFWALGFIVLILYCSFIIVYEKSTDRYHYVSEHRDDYTAFLGGDIGRDVDGFYSEKAENEKEYFNMYREFYDNMSERAKSLSEFTIFSSSESFSSRNLRKTLADYEKLGRIGIRGGNYYAARAYSEHNEGIMFLCVFMGIMAFFCIFKERNAGLFPLIKETKKGHITLAVSKIAVFTVISAVFALLQELLLCVILFRLYGIGDVNSPVQSLPEFRDCWLRLTVIGAIGISIIHRLLITLFLSSVFLFLSMCFYKEYGYFIVSGAFMVVETLFAVMIPTTAGMNYLCCVNPVFVWSISNSVGTYVNLNIFGHPVLKNHVWVFAEAVATAVCFTASVILFCKRRQLRREGFIEELMVKLRGLFCSAFKTVSLLYFSMFKTVVTQKRIFILIALLLFCVFRTKGVFTEKTYYTAEEAAYHYYMDKIEGRMDDSSKTFIKRERNRLDNMRRGASDMMSSGDLGAEFYGQSLLEEASMYESGLGLISEQYYRLMQKEDKSFKRYYLDEMEYMYYWNSPRESITQSLIGLLGALLLISGLFASDGELRVKPLLSATAKGRKQYRSINYLSAVIFSAYCFVMVRLPKLVGFFRIDKLKCIFAPLSNFTKMELRGDWTILTICVSAFLIRVMIYVTFVLVITRISELLRRESFVISIGIGLLAGATALMYIMNCDITAIMLKLAEV